MAEYPKVFLDACNEVIDRWEGTTYTDDPDDPGGGTKFGISSKAYPNKDIEHLTRDQAIQIYYHDYWLTPGMYKLPEAFQAKVFNIGVLIGEQTAKNLLVGCNTMDEYRQVLVKHFEAIVIKHPVCAKYLKGWTRRALA
jgi:lysozyme family protein